LENRGAASRGLGSRFWFPQIALRSYFPVEVGLGAPVEGMTELAGEETTELDETGGGTELDETGGRAELEGRTARVAGVEKPGE
jgi:hypothetical protein